MLFPAPPIVKMPTAFFFCTVPETVAMLEIVTHVQDEIIRDVSKLSGM